MQVRLLGTAAGGGFPQWNCGCNVCAAARSGERPVRAVARSQSSAAVSADGVHWFLLNASPDVRYQIESFEPLRTVEARRGSRIRAVLLTNADLDHVLGLLTLREGERLRVHATAAVRGALERGLRLTNVLENYCGVEWVQPSPEMSPLLLANGGHSGLSYAAIPVAGKAPRYMAGAEGKAVGYSIGYRIVDESTGGCLIYLPDLSPLSADVLARVGVCDLMLVDGTFWSDDEMQSSEVGTLTAAAMDHLPVGGAGGSLARLAGLPVGQKVFVHINNTNPMLLEDSPQRAAVEAAGARVGFDGMAFTI
jgi:pyrroloquinoline quinone biosynthesis protein B